MEVSDYQAAAALVGLPTELTSDTYVYFTLSSAIAMSEYDLNKEQIELNMEKEFVAIGEQQDWVEAEMMTEQERAEEEDFIEIDNDHNQVDDLEENEDLKGK